MEKEVLGDDLEAIRIRVVTGIASEHPAPKVDRRIRFIEGIPFNTPKEWLKYLVLFGVTRFNLLPHSPPWTGASPGELFTVTFVGMSVGEYVQCEVASPDNSMNVRTLSCISRYPTGSQSESCRFIVLKTMSPLPTPDSIISFINNLVSEGASSHTGPYVRRWCERGCRQ
jgi:hypothetical protein